MYCKNCGKEISDNSKFCRWCGFAIDETIKTEEGKQYITDEKHYNNTRKQNTPGCAIFLFIVFVIIVIYFIAGPKIGRFSDNIVNIIKGLWKIS